MTRSITVLWLMTVLASAVLIVYSGQNRARGLALAKGAARRFALVQEQAQELAALRSTGPEPVDAPSGALAPKVSAALARIGAAASSLASLSPEGEAGRGSGIRRKGATLTLASLTLPQVGAFLDDWERAEPAWTVTAIELSPMAPITPAGGDLPLRSVMHFESVLVDERRVNTGSSQ